MKSERNKAVFLDRDGVINVDKNYVYKIEDLEFIPGSVDALKKLKEKGFLLIIITNQSGIGRCYYTEEDYLKFRQEFHKRLKEINSYSGSRHAKRLPTRGQRTKTNSRTVRGNVRTTLASGRKNAPAPK